MTDKPAPLEPHTPADEIANDGLEAVKEAAARRGLNVDQCFVLLRLDDGSATTAATVEADEPPTMVDVLAALLTHAKAVARACGKDIMVDDIERWQRRPGRRRG